jgi:hypothetical protein
MAKHGTRAQRDLFEELPEIGLGALERAKVVKQLQTLLMEAMASLASRQEADDDQDQA